jgi:Nucleotidyl transferase AbiEii toxin, Type IV TA system
MTFEFEHHNKILTVLQSLDPEVLKRGSAYFGGGTLLALDFEEYRWSKDINFIASAIIASDASSGYRYLRRVIFDGGYEALFRDLSQIQIGRGTTDQYGIRMAVSVDGTPIKTEIIAEVRFNPSAPRYPSWSPVACLSLPDCFTSKLLANSDRHLDDGVESRDLIDLAVLRLQSAIPEKSIQKAENAYEVIRPLKNAIARFQERKDYRTKCFSGLQILSQQIPRIIDGIDLLAHDFGLPLTERTFQEQPNLFP